MVDASVLAMGWTHQSGISENLLQAQNSLTRSGDLHATTATIEIYGIKYYSTYPPPVCMSPPRAYLCPTDSVSTFARAPGRVEEIRVDDQAGPP